MEPSELLKLIFNQDTLNFIFTYAATASLDGILAHFKDKQSKRDLSWQLLDTLTKAHENTCEKLGWEYNSDAFLSSYLNSILNLHSLQSIDTLSRIFTDVIGHPVKDADIKCWISCFEMQLVMPEHEQLREYIKLQSLHTGKKTYLIKRSYLNKFKEERFENGDNYLTLVDLYLPNNYKINGEGRSFDDLLETIDSFLKGDLTVHLQKKGIQINNTPNILLIFAHQCTGKSTLISKIIYELTYGDASNKPPIFVVSFADRALKDQGLNAEVICSYLGITLEELSDSVLFIDGLDESNYSSSQALDAIEDLIYDLQVVNCRIVITSRPNFSLSNDLRTSLAIYLQPFSYEQAIKWIDLYNDVFEFESITEIKEQIKSLPPSVKEVILIPYILYSCIRHNINLNRVSELAKLYDLLFYSDNAALIFTPYNQRARNRYRDWDRYKRIITDLSIEYFKSKDNTVPIDTIRKLVEEQELRKITSEFFLLYKNNNSFSFAHESVPNFFIAKSLFDSMSEMLLTGQYRELAAGILAVTGVNAYIPIAITDFVEYFVRSSNSQDNIEPIKFLKAFLADGFSDVFTIGGDLKSIHNCYYNLFINIVRLVIAFIRPTIKSFSSFNLFSELSINEKERFIFYTTLGNANLDCLGVCTFKYETLDGINLSGTRLSNKSLSYSKIRYSSFRSLSGAYLLNADFSLSNFEGAHCSNTDFTNSILFGCSFRGARLNGANFTNCILANADLRGAQLNKAKFDGADLRRAKIFVEQLHELYNFDLSFIRRNHIEVYSGNIIVPDEFLEEEYRRQRPVSYALHKEGWDNTKT